MPNQFMSFIFIFLWGCVTIPLFAQVGPDNYRNWKVNEEGEADQVALVIGNSNYEYNGSLLEPANDARIMADAFHYQGVDVIEAYNLGLIEMEEVILDFARKIKDYEVGIIFYAGHGFQVRGENYLVPTNANPLDELDVTLECVGLNNILDKINDGSKVKIVILDACRDNPFVGNWKSAGYRGSSPGFTGVFNRKNTKFVFSTAVNTKVPDENPFAEQLAAEIRAGGCFEDIFRNVLNNMDKLQPKSSFLQEPWSAGNLRQRVCFGKDDPSTVSWRTDPSNGNNENAYPDKDEDGVPDHLDDCVEQKGLISNDGCPMARLNEWLSSLQEFSTFVMQEEIERLIKIDDPIARGRLGYLYLRDSLVNKQQLGVDLIRRAAGEGDDFGIYQLGALFGEGDLVRKKAGTCKAWFERAAELGDTWIQYKVAIHYEEGKLLVADLRRAHHWMVASARSGLPRAQNELANWYKRGIGITPDPFSSVSWYIRAAEGGLASAQFNLGMCYLKGEGVVADDNEGERWLRAAAKQGHKLARQELDKR